MPVVEPRVAPGRALLHCRTSENSTAAAKKKVLVHPPASQWIDEARLYQHLLLERPDMQSLTFEPRS